MIIVKKTAVLSPRGAHGVSGVARFECFKEKSDVRINLASGRKDLYAVVAVGDERRVVKLGGDRIYLARTDLSGNCAAIVADGEKRVICAGATVCGYDFSPLEELALSAFGDGGKKGGAGEREETDGIKEDIKNTAQEKEKKDEAAGKPAAEEVKEGDETAVKNEEKGTAGEEDKKREKATKSEEEIEKEDVKKQSEKEIGAPEEYRFFDKIADKIAKLFEENEKDEEMNSLIPDSRWARVKTDGGWYVVGVVGEPAEFICYGIPGDDPSDPPEEDEGCRQWVEVEKGGRGYWMMYQSAATGETLKAI